jgi:cysteine-rich repeat protein
VALRSACADPKTESACKAVPVSGGKAELVFPVAAKQTTYVVVDGIAGKSGAYTLSVDISATTCGDGLAQYPEQCDEGNTTSGDGCSATCQLEVPLSAPGKCPGATYAFAGSLAGPKTVSFAGDVSLLASTASSVGCTSAGGKDQVYAITPSISGALRSVLTASYPGAQLHARRECFTSSTQLDCRVQPLASVPLEMTMPVVAQNTYFIFVDSDSSSPGGPYTLDLTLSPPTCGNGTLETPEACDDGNVAPGDGCARLRRRVSTRVPARPSRSAAPRGDRSRSITRRAPRRSPRASERARAAPPARRTRSTRSFLPTTGGSPRRCALASAWP